LAALLELVIGFGGIVNAGSLSSSALAFIAGYAVEPVFATLDSIAANSGDDAGCSACKTRINSKEPIPDHLTNDVLPPLLDRLRDKDLRHVSYNNNHL
jgi:hypothetical protein